jgi:hypothetical protein
MPPDESAGLLREDLRHGRDVFLNHRRAIAGLSIFSTAVLGGVSLFQVGVFRHLPDPPLTCFDSDAVNGSLEAYSRCKTPDALLGMASYAATACLAGMGRKNRWKSARWIPLAMAAKTLLDAAMAAKLTLDEIRQDRVFSFWSLLVTGATFSALPLALPEALRALRTDAQSPAS